MKRLESNFVNMLLSLTIVCIIAAMLLSGIVLLTKAPIEASSAKKQMAAITEVLPFENMTIVTEKAWVDPDSLTIHRAIVNGEEVGVAVETYSTKGFNGLIRLMVGFDNDGNILNYSVLEQAETPGLGAKMVEWFKPQKETKKSLIETLCHTEAKTIEKNSSVIGKNTDEPLMVSKDQQGGIDAITAATISSRAFLDALNRAAKVVNKNAVDILSSASTLQWNENNEEETNETINQQTGEENNE